MITITSDGDLTLCIKDTEGIPCLSLLSSSKVKTFTLNLFYEQVYLYITEYQFVVDTPIVYLNCVPNVWYHFYFS